MAETIGLVERAAALLRQHEAAPGPAPGVSRPRPWPAPTTGQPDPRRAAPAGPELALDADRLARWGIALPAAERSRTVEEFRLVKRQLMAAAPSGTANGAANPARPIMVTSTRPGEGKTFAAINLALAFASEQDSKAILVDLDTQHGMVARIFGIGAARGIVDALTGEATLAEVLIRTSLPNLLLLPAGAGGPHVPELLASNRMARLVSELTERFPDRIVVIDTPPCMASSDAATLAPLVGQIVFVVEAHRTQREEIEAALGMLGGGRPIRLLLNKSERVGDHFGGYGYNGYDFGGSGNSGGHDGARRQSRPTPV